MRAVGKPIGPIDNAAGTSNSLTSDPGTASFTHAQPYSVSSNTNNFASIIPPDIHAMTHQPLLQSTIVA